MYSMLLLVSLVVIVLASVTFCNALEHLGDRLNISEGVTGSIFAAVGTALPETIIPILAIFSGYKQTINAQIGVGAILGAPLMLSTLSLFVMALSVCIKRGINGLITPELSGLKRDLRFFIGCYTIALIVAFIPKSFSGGVIHILAAIFLLLAYFVYILLTIKASSALVEAGLGTSANRRLLFEYLQLRNNAFVIMLQLLIALLALIYAAEVFISAVKHIALAYSMSPFLLSLIIIPIATELPEKINSIIWLRNGKDTLAISNITGAMVFQGSLLPVIGILFSDWSLNTSIPLFSIVVTLMAALWLYANARSNNIRVWHFILNGAIYVVNIAVYLR